MLKVIIYIIKVIFKEMDKYIGKNRGYSILFIIRIWIS